MATTATLLTVAEFEKLPLPDDKRVELVHGEVVEMGRGNLHHETVKGDVSLCFHLFDPGQKHGRVYVETTFQLSSNDTRMPGVAYVLKEQIPKPLPKTYPPAPALAVETVSSESAENLFSRVDDYLRAGTKTVWVILPDHRSLIVFEADGSIRRLNPPDTITISWLPGFSTPVADFFQSLS
ncbi:MAG: Uma2 family endonuclease [Acidobacteria bacterium]|nr:Uma2 family endonuclease [Acidobacteriota bacterium]